MGTIRLHRKIDEESPHLVRVEPPDLFPAQNYFKRTQERQ